MCEKTVSALINASVSLNEKVARDTYRMILTTPDWHGEDPRPGQFLMLRAGRDTDPLLARPFGVSGFARVGNGAEVEIIYRTVGRGTRMMESWPAGQRASFLGPLGKGFALPPKGSSSLLVAGGVGLPPLLSLARAMEKLGRSGEVTLLYGEKGHEFILDPGSDFFPAMGTQTCTEDGSCGTPGMVTSLLEAMHLGEGFHLFVCGPNPMMRAVLDLTGGRCLSSQYSLEARMACGFGVCSGCAVKLLSGDYVRVCKEGPVFDGKDLSEESFREI